MPVEAAHFEVPREVVPPRLPDSPPPNVESKALVPASPAANLPALIDTNPRGLAPIDVILPSVTAAGWLVTLALNSSATLPVLAAISAAGLASVAVMGRKALSRLSAPKPADPALAETYFGYATDSRLDNHLRLEHAHNYVRAVPTISGANLERLLGNLPTGLARGFCLSVFGHDWLIHTRALKKVGLKEWKGPWIPFSTFVTGDLEVVFGGLTKLGPVTAKQRASIEGLALYVIRNFQNRTNKTPEYRADLEAGVIELVRRAPAAAEAS